MKLNREYHPVLGRALVPGCGLGHEVALAVVTRVGRDGVAETGTSILSSKGREGIAPPHSEELKTAFPQAVGYWKTT